MQRVSVLAGGMLLLAGCAFGQTYEVTDLGTLGGFGSVALDVNESGLVVGASNRANGGSEAFAWRNGVMVPLGMLQGHDSSRAVSINDEGQIVGFSALGQATRAVRWAPDGDGWTITDLGALPGGTGSRATRITNNRTVIGQSSRAGGSGWHAFVMPEGGGMQDLGALHYPPTIGFSEARGVNEAGVVVGFAYAPTFGPEHGFYYDPSHPPALDITLPGQFEFAHPMAVNNANVVAGWISGALTSGNFRPAVYTQADGWVVIGVLSGHTDGYGYGINDAGQVVGVSFNPLTQDNRGFLYDGNGVRDINDLLVPGSDEFVTEASSINESGEIAANGVQGFAPRALLLRPSAVCEADYDGDGFVTGQDFDDFVADFEAGDARADFNGDGFVTGQDFDDFIGAFEAGCS